MRAELEALTEMPTLPGERVTLRPLTPADTAALYEVFSDPKAMRYWSEPPHPSPARTDEMLASIIRGFEDRSNLQWGIERNSDRALMGTVTLMPAPDQPRAELGYILGSPYWGSGYGREAQTMAIDFAFGELAVHRVEADTHPKNVASVRSLERLGFRIEGLQRERWLVAGERSDSLLLGLLAREWRGGDSATASGR